MRRAVVLLLLMFCARRHDEPATSMIGTPSRGRHLMTSYGCTACHTIPGVSGESLVGPPLTKMARRAYIAGRLPNEPAHMIDWIRAPQSIDPATAMPNLGVTERDARDMAAYLFTLR